MTTAISTSEYQIELRDKNGNLKQYLTPYVSKVSWEWNRIGGCGRCSLTIQKGYRDIIFSAMDDIQIRVKTPSYLDRPTNHLNNGDLEIWSAGASAAPDDWTKYGAGSSVAREGTTKRVGTYSAKLTRSGADCNLYQNIHAEKGIAYWQGKTVTFGCWVYAANASSAYLYISDGVGVTGSTPHPGDSTWHWITITRTIDASATKVELDLTLYLNDVSVYFDGAILVEGSLISDRTYSATQSKLVYRGYIANISPTLKVNQDVVLDIRGYYDLMKKLVVHTTGDTRTYTTKTVAYVVDDIADTFIIPNSDITLGTIDSTGGSAFEMDSIGFLCTVDEALSTLADLAGDAEYGVDEDLVFYWRTESTTINRRFFIGNDVTMLERKVSFDNLVNKIYLVGGDVGDPPAAYRTTVEDTDSQTEYFLSEVIVNNSSITTASVAAQYCGAILTEKSTPQFSIRGQVKNTNVRLEDTIPMGLVTFYDPFYDRDSIGDLIGDIIGEAADGGSDITIGETADGGSDVTVGGQYSAQINRISYELSDTPGRFNIEIELGDVILETAAKIKRLERALSSIQQGA